MSASTTVLPPPTCTARREAGQHLRLLFCCEAGQLLAVVSLRPVPGRSSAGCVRLQWLCSAGCVPARLCHAMPTALNVLAPVHLLQVCLPPFTLLRLPLFIAMCARIGFRASSLSSNQHVCKLRELSRWQLQHGPAEAARAPVHFFDLLPFSCRVHDPGPWV